jgi:hypothetical protein
MRRKQASSGRIPRFFARDCDMPTGTIRTTKIDEIKVRDGVRSECFKLNCEPTPSRRFDETTLDGVKRAVKEFADELAAQPHCYRVYVRLDEGQRAPNGFRALSESRNSALCFLVNPEKAMIPENAL